ncbi:hypothetical protein BCO18175_03702 [Burkholderia contaminans]|uniref:hypothetical protein n=1 Tax=Burkholderia contaminans TaxID=488447 RepID=UPI001452C753|nr:hypothetical protein [Burkholderia contaminans]VWC95888.1 hypothetical protein BCO18175_03702 [Burkholderia contaminans]
MPALQKINLGTAPEGRDGDTVRVGFTKLNANVDALSNQAALVSGATITQAQALTSAHIGERINFNFPAAGTVNLPAASTCPADSVLHLRNVGATVVTLAIAAGSGDTLALSRLNPGEAATLDTDGVHAWNVLLRGRSASDNETVNGSFTVTSPSGVAGVQIGGSAGQYKVLTFATGPQPRWQLLTDNSPESGSNAGANIAFSRYADNGAWIDSPLTITRSSGVVQFSKRPTWAGVTPWDSGNFNPGTYVTTNTFQVLPTRKRIYANQVTGQWGDQTFVVESDLGQTGIGFRATNTGGVFRLNSGNSSFECVSWDSNAYAPITASSFNVGSDYRLKNLFGEVVDPIARVRRFCPVMAEYKSQPGKVYPMFLAHKLQEVAPHAVSGDKDAVDSDGKPVYQSVDYSKLTPDLTAAIIALADENDALRARIVVIEEKIGVVR